MNQFLLDRERAIWNAEAERLLDEGGHSPPITGYEPWIRSKAHYHLFDDFLRENPQKHRPVLQFGGGDIFFLLLPDIGYRSFEIGDLADRALDVARARAATTGKKASYNYRQLDAHDLSYAGGQFGLVIANAVLHHLDRKRFVPELARVVAPGGRALFFDPHLAYPLRAMLWSRALRRTDRGSDNPLTNADIKLFRRWFDVHVTKFGALSALLTRLLPMPLDRQRRIDIQNALMSWDLKLAANLPGYSRLFCNQCILMAERNNRAV